MRFLNSYSFLAFFLLFPLLSLKSQDFWEQLYFPDSTAIRCIAVNDQGDIFVGAANDGVSGGVYRSTDTAQTWELVLDLGEFSAHSISINENGYIYVGITGSYNFMVSQDYGENWNALILPSNGNVSSIQCIGSDTVLAGLAVSNGALLLRSIDGGQNWDSVFVTIGHPGENISDIALSSSGKIYFSMMCFFPDMGGIYKSENGGDTWDYVGLINHQVHSVEFNSNDDLFIGVWSDFIYTTGGLYAIFNGSDSIEELITGPSVTEMVINSNDDIYFADVPAGIIRSEDNGQTFEYVNEGLSGEVGIMSIDSQGFIYLASSNSNNLARSINPTITGIETKPLTALGYSIKIVPNPATDYFALTLPEEPTLSKSYTIYIYDVSGNLFFEETKVINGNSFQQDISKLATGVYFIKIVNENLLVTAKFIKK